MNTKLYILCGLALTTIACQGKIGFGDDPVKLQSTDETPEATTEPTPQPDAPQPGPTVEPEVVYEIPEFTAPQLISYMRTISQMLVSRPLTPAEAAKITESGVDALEPILRDWAVQPAFAQNARYMMQQQLKASGQRDDIDFELPGNLVHHIVANNLPWSTVLTADYCIDAAGNEAACDTGAPYAAGVLATRAFMAGNASRFNLGRANRLMEAFACRIYPMESAMQPYLERESLIPMFQVDKAEDQTVEAAKGGFGNGDGCYSCHGQFGAHAQLFVKFAENGMYAPDADGQQDANGELGRSINGLMTSHMNDPARAASEASQMFGSQVANLAEAAAVMADGDAFLPCQVRKIVHFAFGMSESSVIESRMLRTIAQRAKEISATPTYADLVVAAFTEPRVILSAVVADEGGAE